MNNICAFSRNFFERIMPSFLCSRRLSGAFSLIEITIVIAILGVLSAYAVPHYMNWALDAKKARARQDLAMLAEQISKYELDQNLINMERAKSDADKKAVRLKSLNELKGKYVANLDKLRDPWGYEYLVLPENGSLTIEELTGYLVSDITIEVKINNYEDLPSDINKIDELVRKENWLPENKDKITHLIYRVIVSDIVKKEKNINKYFYKENLIYSKFYLIPSVENPHPKIVYSKGPNGRDEKGKGDDIKHACMCFKYLKGEKKVEFKY